MLYNIKLSFLATHFLLSPLLSLFINITTEYPIWLFIFCLIAGFFYSLVLYYKEKKNEFSPLLIRILAVFRFVTILLITFLLLSPLFKSVFRHVEKPIIIVAQDNSQSIILSKDSLFYKTNYLKNLNDFIEKLKKNYEVKSVLFGEKVYDFNITKKPKLFIDKETDIASVFDEIENNYSDRNVGAVVLASDGIFNKGANPLYSSKYIKIPVYTIALGDTTIPKDISILKVNHNKIGYLGNKFPVEIIVNAFKCKGLSSELKVLKGKNVLFSQTIDFTSNIFNKTVLVQLEAKETGLQNYRITISPVKDEISVINNTQDIFIDVLDSRQKILILAATPHPDISALKQAFESNTNYEATVFMQDDFNKSISGYNLVILHQIPSFKNPSTRLLSAIAESKIPVLYIIGSQTNLNALNNLNVGVNILITKNINNEALAFSNKDFSLFTLNPETWRIVNNFPPLISPFGQYKMQSSANVLFYQKIGSVVTNQPLIMFNQLGDSKNGIIAGEGIWRWKFSNYAQKNNFSAFNEIISKTVQYLSVKEDKSFFKVYCKNHFFENESVEFDAEVYNDSYELINDPEVEMTITNDEGKKFPYTFSKTTNAYHLDAGILPVGVYKYLAKTKVGNKLLEKKGEQSILPLNVEGVNTIANHQLLYNLSKKHDGEMFYPQQFDELIKKIKERPDIRSIAYFQKRYNEIVNLPWIFFMIILLLSVEWFLRKNNGGY